MAITDMRVGTNDFVPKEDVTKKLDDGREIVVARAGTPMPMAQAVEFGLVKDPAGSKKAQAPAENKLQQPAGETKTNTPAETGPEPTAKGGKQT